MAVHTCEQRAELLLIFSRVAGIDEDTWTGHL
jgi:hypothetical protein